MKMKSLHRLVGLLLVFLLVGGVAYNCDAQVKKGSNTSAKKTNKKKPVTKPKPTEIPLPTNSNDCIFAIELQPDVAYGPTTAPRGGGRVQDVMRDKNNPWVFEYEHNSVWYKVTIPYNGYLTFDITQTNPKDDYDFIVFKYTDEYFSNHIIQGKVKPVAANLGAVDSAAKAGTPTLGMHYNDKAATKLFVGAKSTDGFVKAVPVRKGDVYYIALDCKNAGSGHTIKVSVSVDSYKAMVFCLDPTTNRRIEVDMLILEKNTDNRPIVKNPHFRIEKVTFVPNFDYTLYAKKDGYFSVFKDFNANIFKEDTTLGILMQPMVKGTSFSLSDVYFDDNGSLLPESDSALMAYVSMFRNHTNISFQIKGYVQSYGVNMERDMQLSLDRANSVKDFFVKHGIAENRIAVLGMTRNEIKRSATAALNTGQAFSDTKIKLVITSIDAEK